ncbi:MAG: DUF1080 domain-containing protein [Alistipes sp.]|nr:DUF1080 domain-containing protein [Alistipes sp.]
MKKRLFAATLCTMTALGAWGQEAKTYPEPAPMTPQMSEFWTPQPRIVTPPDMDNAIIAPPSDAIVLLGLNDNAITQWVNCEEGKPVAWEIKEGIMTVTPHSGSIRTKQEFGDYQLHMEWSAPTEIVGESQGRGNSGVFMQGRYEVQILDCYQNESYANGQAGSIYKQTPPLVNACQKPGKWNTYDIIYTAPRFKEDGSLQSNGRITVLHNGVLIQNNTLILGTTEFIGFPKIVAHGKGPIILQDHLNPVRFRNIWIREL